MPVLRRPDVSRSRLPLRHAWVLLLGAALSAEAAPRETLLSTVDDIARQVAALRGLPQKTPFRRGVLSREEIGTKLRERIRKEYSPEEVRVEADVLKRMGLLPRGADYEKLLYDLLTEQVAGFYDPYNKTLYVADWLPLELQRPAMAHEIEHALQDQHFDLQRFSKPFKDDGDRQFSRAAVVEGDGTALMLEFVARSMGLDLRRMPSMVSRLGKEMMQLSMGATPSFSNAPAVLRETLLFPYTAGLDFVQAIRGGEPWTHVDELFRRPPDSTEQVLHPEKYRAKEAPVPINPQPLPALLAQGYREVRRDVLGELLLRVWFQSAPKSEGAEAAAAGWGGDRLVAYARPAKEGAEAELPLVLLHTVWDTEADAREAANAATRVLAALDRAQEVGSSSNPDGGSAVGPYFGLERKERQLLVMMGVPRELRARVQEEVLRLWRVGGPADEATRPARQTRP